MQRLIRDRPFMHLAAIIFTGFMGENVYAFYIYTYIRGVSEFAATPLCILVPALKLVFQVDDTLVPPSRRDRRLLSYSIPSRSRLVTINRSFRRSLMEREGDGAIPSEFALVYRRACISDPSSFVRSGADFLPPLQ